ncbi:MAG: MFS transporter, partial [Acidithiobacillus sp.]
FLMQRCQKSFEATHFAIGSALMSVASTVAGSYSGFLAAKVGFTAFFLLAFVAALPSLVIAYLLPKDLFPEHRHRV